MPNPIGGAPTPAPLPITPDRQAQLDKIKSTVNDVIYTTSNKPVDVVYNWTLGNIVGLGNFLGGDGPFHGIVGQIGHSQGIQQTPAVQAIINNNNVTPAIINQVNQTLAQTHIGNCAEQSCFAVGVAMTQSGNLGAGIIYMEGHAVCGIDFNRDGVYDAYVDPWKGKTGPISDLDGKIKSTTDIFVK